MLLCKIINQKLRKNIFLSKWKKDLEKCFFFFKFKSKTKRKNVYQVIIYYTSRGNKMTQRMWLGLDYPLPKPLMTIATQQPPGGVQIMESDILKQSVNKLLLVRQQTSCNSSETENRVESPNVSFTSSRN